MVPIIPFFILKIFMIYFLIFFIISNAIFIALYFFEKDKLNLSNQKYNVLEERLKFEIEKNVILQKSLDESKTYKEVKKIVEETKQNKKDIEAANALFANTKWYHYTTKLSNDDVDKIKSDLDNVYKDLSNTIEGFKNKK